MGRQGYLRRCQRRSGSEKDPLAGAHGERRIADLGGQYGFSEEMQSMAF